MSFSRLISNSLGLEPWDIGENANVNKAMNLAKIRFPIRAEAVLELRETRLNSFR